MNPKIMAILQKFALVSALFIGFSSASQAEIVTATVSAVHGDVSIITPTGDSVAATKGLAISAGSKIVSKDGRASVVWMDGARSLIEENTTTEVSALRISSDSGNVYRRVELKLTAGTIVCQTLVHNANSGAIFYVKTPIGMITDKGTVFTVTVNSDGTVTVSDTAGTSLFTSTGKLSGEQLTLIKAGTTFTFTSDGNSTTDTLSPGDIASVNKLINDAFGSAGGDESGNPDSSGANGGSNTGAVSLSGFAPSGGGGETPLSNPGSSTTPTPTPPPSTSTGLTPTAPPMTAVH